MQAGQRIRDYVLDQKIGQGSMGEVWSAVHSVLQRAVAIKGMGVQAAADPQLRERFLQEARAQARLQHPRVLGMIDAFQEGGVDYLVMPLVAGRSLAERLTEAGGPLPPAEPLRQSHFVVQGARQANCQLSAYFHYAKGDILKDFDQDYKTDDGQVSVWENFTPQYDSTEFEDFTLFMPYDELHMTTGSHELKFDLQVHHRPSGKVAAQSPYVSFTLDQS